MTEFITGWAIEHGTAIVVIIAGSIIVKKLAVILLKRFESRIKQEGAVPSEQEKRIKTISGLLNTTISVLVYAVAALMILAECEIRIGPVLAAAGIAGVAIGFGAQWLVKDIITGFFLLMENQIRIGDVVTVAGISGLVEAVNLRTTRLRDLEGKVHIIPNGCIDVATNFTRDWSRALVEIGVAYKEDVDEVINMLKLIGQDMENDPQFSDIILEPLTVLGVDSFGDSSVNIRMYFKTAPIKQWDVAREFRRRVKKVFDDKGIEIPFPHRTVYMGEAQTRGRLQVEASLKKAPA